MSTKFIFEKKDIEWTENKTTGMQYRTTSKWFLAVAKPALKFGHATVGAQYGQRIENKQKGHSTRNLWSLCPHACRITHAHYAGSGQSIAFSGQ